MKKDRRRMYSDLVWIWPIISPPEDYIEEAGEFAAVMRQYAPTEIKTLLDLGCGGGHNDHTLRKHFTVTGVDISEEMLALAQKLNPDVRYLLGDMRTVRLGETFDAVFIADSIDYMHTEDELRMAFETAYAHLKPGGIFCTYAEETRERFQQNRTNTSARTRGDIQITIIENSYDPDPSDSTFELTFVYLIRQNGQLSIETDRHVSGLFGLETWIRLLEDAGFEAHVTEYEAAGPMFVGVKGNKPCYTDKS